jgi:flagellar motor switch protein FliN/FliY
MTAARPAIRLQPSAPKKKASGGMEWWGQSLSLSPAPAIWVGASAQSWKSLGRAILQAIGANDSGDADLEAACRDVLAQTSSALSQRLSGEFAEEVTGGDVVQGSAPAPLPETAFHFVIDTGSNPFEGVAFLDPPFLARLQEIASRLRNRAEAARQAGPMDQLLAKGPKVELRVRVVLGRANLRLRDIFKLNVGSVVELDRSVTDAAEIVVDDVTIAHGEVVVVDGNYGVKVIA